MFVSHGLRFPSSKTSSHNAATTSAARLQFATLDSLLPKRAVHNEAILHEILEHSISFAVCNFGHEFRSSNFEAHNLAKHVLKLGVGRHVWLGHPGNLSFISVNIGAV